MGGDKIINPSDQQMVDYIKYLPDVLKTVAKEAGPYLQSMLNLKQVISPQEMAQEQALLEGFGPAYAKELLGLSQLADPEFYGLRNQSAAKMSELVGGLDPNKMSGGEMTEVERGLNRLAVNQGTNRIPSNTAAISNALVFGDRLMQKKKDVAGVMSTVPSFLSSVKSGLDIPAQVTGRPSYGQSSMNQFGAVPVGIGQQYLTEAGQNSRTYSQLLAQKRDSLDRFNETFGSVMGGLGSLTGGMM